MGRQGGFEGRCAKCSDGAGRRVRMPSEPHSAVQGKAGFLRGKRFGGCCQFRADGVIFKDFKNGFGTQHKHPQTFDRCFQAGLAPYSAANRLTVGGKCYWR